MLFPQGMDKQSKINSNKQKVFIQEEEIRLFNLICLNSNCLQKPVHTLIQKELHWAERKKVM